MDILPLNSEDGGSSMAEGHKRDSDTFPVHGSTAEVERYKAHELRKDFAEHAAYMNNKINKLEERLNSLQNWQSYVIGAAAAAGTLVGLLLALAKFIPGGK